MLVTVVLRRRRRRHRLRLNRAGTQPNRPIMKMIAPLFRALLVTYVLGGMNMQHEVLLYSDAFTFTAMEKVPVPVPAIPSSSFSVVPKSSGTSTASGTASSSLNLFGGLGDESDDGTNGGDASDTRRRARDRSGSFIARGGWRNRNYGQRSTGGRSKISGKTRFDRLRDEATIDAILERVLTGSAGSGRGSSGIGSGDDRRLVKLQLAGRGSIPLPTTDAPENFDDTTARSETIDIPCLFLSDHTSAESSSGAVMSVPVPLADSPQAARRQLKLLSFAHRGEPISKSLFLTVAPILTGRDGALWDNLPWTTWTIDPNRNRIVDAAGNPVLDKYHPGKRDAFERMGGKDWYGRSLSGGNLKARLEYWLDGLDDISQYDSVSEDHAGIGIGDKGEVSDVDATNSAERQNEEEDSFVEPLFDDNASSVLARRILEVKLNEASMAVAEVEEKLAMVRGQSSDDNNAEQEQLQDVKASLDELDARRSDLGEVEAALSALSDLEGQDDSSGGNDASSKTMSILRDLLAAISSAKMNDPAPYRGAYGYAAVIDSPEEMFMKSILPYRSPYDLLLEIISEQLNADVIGTAVEDTSLFDGEVVLGGAIVLRRRGRPKSITVSGETLEITDEDDDFGNAGLKEGEIVVVECDADEAIGLALASGLEVLVETNIWETSRLNAFFTEVNEETKEDKSIVNSIPLMESPGYVDLSDSDVFREDQNMAASSMPQPPKTTDDFLDFFAPKTSTTVFSADNPVKTLNEYDALSDQDKARILLSLQSFQGQLPRPRVLRESQNNKSTARNDKDGLLPSTTDALDELLIPFVDESVRRAYRIRDAEKRGDIEEANRLREGKSKRQIAKERAAAAMEGDDSVAARMWEEEAELQANVRADVTQDEGEYSRFLDRDDWYERERIVRVKRLKRSKFGTLLDGIE